MSASVPFSPNADHQAPADPVLTLTGERTIPDLDIENYWFRRHEVGLRAAGAAALRRP